ncbi:MAG TPA: TIGR04083 family peptide-modifying radical SAM enzyme [Methanotrichaceae archaeon]|nr:TIGR04083 family peptide-modifying radical SAM enzyme [Methanotrichaceae archaeon]
MIIPTLGCPSNCSYCWSSDEKSPIMDTQTVDQTVEWLREFRKDPVTITFHGGEPLMAGLKFYRHALPVLADGLRHIGVSFAMQSNMWLLSPELAEILAEYKIPIGSSLDGPQEVNDSQRGRGYYEKTMRGYRTAKEHGLSVRFICTFTSQSVRFKEDIFNFFMENGFVMKLHPALPSLRGSDPDSWSLAPQDYGELLVYLLDRYLEKINEVEIMNINDLCRGVLTSRGTVCTFADCMDSTYAVGPEGSIYPCYRFVGMPQFVMGNVSDRPSLDDLKASAAWKRMQEFKEYVNKECKSCRHIRYCRGGCPYNAIVPTSGEIAGVDPHCLAYRRIFDEINSRFNKEMFGGMRRGAFPEPYSDGKPSMMALMRKISSDAVQGEMNPV